MPYLGVLYRLGLMIPNAECAEGAEDRRAAPMAVDAGVHRVHPARKSNSPISSVISTIPFLTLPVVQGFPGLD